MATALQEKHNCSADAKHWDIHAKCSVIDVAVASTMARGNDSMLFNSGYITDFLVVQ